MSVTVRVNWREVPPFQGWMRIAQYTQGFAPGLRRTAFQRLVRASHGPWNLNTRTWQSALR